MSETELNQKETSAYLKSSIRKLDRQRAEGRGPAFVRLDGRIFYRRSDLDRYIAANVHGGDLRDTDASGDAEPRHRSRPRKSADVGAAS